LRIPVRPHGRIVVPPIEVPPPDDRADRADRATIDAVLADLGWQRRLPSVGEVLVVGDRWMGRAIAYRQTQFVYGHTHGHRWGRTLCAFSTAAAARRFMILELSRMLRNRIRLLPRIQLNRLAPGCTLEKGPTGFELASSDGLGTFPLGFQGRQNALDFSWVATADAPAIAASYCHLNGEPLFDLNHSDQPPAG
jgi:hypothetical protein